MILVSYPSFSEFIFMLLPNLHPIQFSVTLVNPNPNLSCNVPFSRSSLQIHHRFRRPYQRRRDGDWGSNAEEFRYKFQEEEDKEFGDVFELLDEGSDDIIDKIWIFKVFKAYGYLLPGIIVSLLLANGLKAFLITMAIALSLSAISLAFENIQGSVSRKPRTRATANKKKNPFSTKYSGKNSSQRQEKRKRNSKHNERNGYKSWISSMDFSKEDVDSKLGGNNFGGWDELYNEEDSVKKAPPIQSKMRMKEENVSWKGGRDDEPLFLRLLIAVFPFLRSWMTIL